MSRQSHKARLEKLEKAAPIDAEQQEWFINIVSTDPQKEDQLLKLIKGVWVEADTAH